METTIVKRIKSLMRKNDFSENYIQRSLNKLHEKFQKLQSEDFDVIKKELEEIIESDILIKKAAKTETLRIIFVVGPSGSGKTTVGFSLVANELFESHKSGKKRPVKLISTSNKVGASAAVERIGIIMDAETADISMKLSIEEQKKAVSESKADIIFIDTDSNSDIPAHFPQSEIYLALPATLKTSALDETVSKYKNLPLHSVIVTKCDETEKYGNIISVLSKHKLPVSYITTSWKIPKGLIPLEKSKLCQLTGAEKIHNQK